MSTAKTESTWIAQLLRRAGFGYTPSEFKYYRSLGYKGTLEELLNPKHVDNSALEKAIADQSFDFTNPNDLRRWWLYRMVFTRRPLEEKMSLFLHGHFATSDRKVRNPHAMYLQNLLFRKYALGDFAQLLLNVSKDPAMIVWLDNQQNRKGKPNENFAREVMELFTVGIGNYTENDIKEAARAFTGWHAKPDGFFFNKNQHDFGQKTVLGVTGNLSGEDIVSILAKHPQTGHSLARKLIAFFAHDNPDNSFVERVARAYRESKYCLGPMLKTIFLDRSFLSDKTYHAKIKSPAELVVGTLKVFQIENLDNDLPQLMGAMGQDLFHPPSVKGWDGGEAWISSDTMMERFNFAARICTTRFDELTAKASPSQLIQKHGLTNTLQLVDYFVDLLVDGDVPQTAKDKLVEYVSIDLDGKKVSMIEDDRTLDAKLRGLVHLIMTLPTYQLT
ncbi:MAG: DUF1800 domain-containing protein [Candidatus Melainabacteria bacterium]|nr:DUF1800 domain-containing protein [Candidatus Melainabacteria bacterium]